MFNSASRALWEISLHSRFELHSPTTPRWTSLVESDCCIKLAQSSVAASRRCEIALAHPMVGNIGCTKWKLSSLVRGTPSSDMQT
ncbi:hypothetical protein V6N13_052143 [Hibiscus sabdariffa]|uniref:Uncharacterized protein n=2 Tax=Hibiscus sabdariffa TaxID=183260 RepID=A0ABR2T614_9ROSI